MANVLGIRDVWAVRIFGVVAALLQVLTLLFCMINGSHNYHNYLLGLNTIFSSLIGMLVARWYNIGELPSSKLWYVLAFGSMLIVQSIVYDVYAFLEMSSPIGPSTTAAPTTIATTITSSGTTVTTPPTGK